MPDYDQNESRNMDPRTQRMQQQPVQMQPWPPPPKRRVRRTIRWEYLAVPAAIAVFAAFMHAAQEPPFTWNQVMDWLHVVNRERYTRLGVLCVLAVACIAILRIARDTKTQDDGPDSERSPKWFRRDDQ